MLLGVVVISGGQKMNSKNSEVYVGLDVHKDTIAVAIAAAGRSKPEFRGEIRNEAQAVRRLVKRLGKDGEALSFCYEADPCGYGVYWQIQELGYPCVVVAPSLIPRRPGDRVKTDRRDALNLARLHRTSDLTDRQPLPFQLMNHDDVPQFDHLMSSPSDEFRWLFWPISSSGDMPLGTERQPSKLAIFTLAQLGIINPVLTLRLVRVDLAHPQPPQHPSELRLAVLFALQVDSEHAVLVVVQDLMLAVPAHVLVQQPQIPPRVLHRREAQRHQLAGRIVDKHQQGADRAAARKPVMR